MEGAKPGWRVNADPPSSDGTTSSTTESPRHKLQKREQWAKKLDFLLACIGFSVGLGNVWRFPFLCYRNGGGAFLIPYFLAAILGGVPMFFLEVSLGQYMGEGGIGPWKIAPLFQGIGYATAVIVFLLNCEYNIILSWAFYYIFASFTTVLPWSHCKNDWNTINCTNFDDLLQGDDNGTSVNGTDVTSGAAAALPGNSSGLALAMSGVGNGTGYKVSKEAMLAGIKGLNMTTVRGLLSDPVTEFWERKVLGLSSGVGEPGTIKWDLALCLLLAWIVVYFCICKGIKSSGKVMYVTATSPYVFMFILLIRGVTLEGASEGLDYYLNPKWEKLADAQVWVDAGTQIFFSYSIGLGTLTALGSYNKFHHNCFRDTLIFGAINSMTSFLAGFVIFSVLGFMAHRQGVSIDAVAESGPGLAFIAYPEAVAQMPVAPLWSGLFFIMIILLGLDSQFVGVEGFVTACVDLYPTILRRNHRKEIFIAVVCIICYFVGLSMVTEGGMYVFQLFDYYSASRIVILVAAFECFVVSYIYGIDRFCDNLIMMFGFHNESTAKFFKWVVKLFWSVLTPIFTMTIFILGCVSYSELTYKRKFITYNYPPWAIGVGWLLALISVALIPVFIIQRIIITPGSFTERLRILTTPHLKRHQLRPNEDMTRVILQEDEFFTHLEHKIEHQKFLEVDHQMPLGPVTDKDMEAGLQNGHHDRLLNGYSSSNGKV